MTVLPLSHTILLRRLRTRCLMNKSMVVKIRAETLINIFAAIVRADNSEFGRKLSLDHRMERLKDREYLVFIFHQIESCHVSTVINKDDEPMNSRDNRNWGRSPHIRVNKCKRNTAFIKTWQIRSTVTFSYNTSRAFQFRVHHIREKFREYML
jgi:hypothetical protein